MTFLLFDDIYSVYLSSFTLLIGGLKLGLLLFFFCRFFFEFYLTHWRFETLSTMLIKINLVKFYLTHWRFETQWHCHRLLCLTNVLPYSLEVWNIFGATFVPPPFTPVLPYSLEVWNNSSAGSSTSSTSVTSFTLLIRGLKLYHISHKQNPHSFICFTLLIREYSML